MKKLSCLAMWLFTVTSLSTHAQDNDVVDGASIFGDMSARQIGPALMSGRVNDLEIHPNNHKIIYHGLIKDNLIKLTKSFYPSSLC